MPAIPTATVDSIAPTLLAATVDAALITLTYDETVRRAGNQGWPFEYKIGAGDFSTVCGYHIDGRTVKQTLCAAVNAEDAIELRYEFTPPAAHLEDTAGNDAPPFTQALDNVTSATAPTITGVEITSDPNDDMRMGDDETYAIGDTVEVTVTFDGSVTVNTAAGTPELELDVGASAVRALYSSGSGSSEFVFTYHRGRRRRGHRRHRHRGEQAERERRNHRKQREDRRPRPPGPARQRGPQGRRRAPDDDECGQLGGRYNHRRHLQRGDVNDESQLRSQGRRSNSNQGEQRKPDR